MNKRKFQSGNVQLIAIILLAIALIGTLGFVYYQNFIQEKDKVSNIYDINVPDKDDGSKTDDTENIDEVNTMATIVTPIDKNEGFFALDDWNVKFELPTDLGDDELLYQKGNVNNSVEGYWFSTKKLSAFGDDCVKAYLLLRSSSSFETGIGAPISLGKIGDYYYGYQTPQASCAEDREASKAIETKMYTMLPETFKSIENK